MASDDGEVSPEPGQVLRRIETLGKEAVTLLDALQAAERRAADAFEAELERTVQARMAAMPLDALKTASGGRLRLGALADAGVDTLGAVRSRGRRGLQALPGVGAKTSTQVMAAVEQVESAFRKATPVRFDVEQRPPTQTELLGALRELETVRDRVEPMRADLEAAVQLVDLHLQPARLQTRRIRRLFAGARRKQEAEASMDALAALAVESASTGLDLAIRTANETIAGLDRRSPDPWADYLARTVAYNGLLIDLSGLSDDTEAAHGHLPSEIVDRIAAFELDTSLLTVSLRGYQAFGAKFALVQERVILGDEMGLGKTIEALAVIAHLRAEGASHFLVISPTSVLANWEHEITRHTDISQTWRLHGPERDERLARWARDGGIALTTFGTLRALDVPEIDLAAVVVDEAHYVKNPDAKRTQAVRAWLQRANRALLMSGTPMENRVEEFRTLVDHLRPDVADGIRTVDGVAGADAFRQAVAPVYLRRNQVDVLDELPPKIETPEWLSLEGDAALVYRRAVADGNIMAMRRAAFMTERPLDSPKLERLLEIVEEAAANDRKVVVFSFFLDVIARVHEAVGPLAAGPLTGSVPATQRQEIIDRFTSREGPAVLVGQIEAGGVGLNIQAASVVILTEPQWKPSTEEQAIARCHRLGQVRPVEVHRLLAEDSVDERMLELLSGKSELFAEFARKSDLKDAAPEAIDVTDQEAVTGLASQADQERRIIDIERRRLGIDAA